MPAVNPGRPTFTDVGLLTAPGYLELESGLNYVRSKTGSDDQFSQAVLFKLTDRPGQTEYRLSASGYVVQRAAGMTSRGSGDIVLGVQHLFAVQTELYGFAGNFSNDTNIVNGYGFTYTPRPDHVYDAYLGFGLSRAAPKYTLTVRHTFFLGKLF